MRQGNNHLSRICALIGHLRIETSEEGKQNLLDELSDVDGPRIVSFLNANGFNVAWQNDLIRENLVSSDWLLRDGIGIAILFAIFGRSRGFNLNGSDIIPELLERYRGKRVLMMGTCSPWDERAAQNARVRHGVQIAGTLDGFRDHSEYLEMAVAHPADLVILGMGTPKQEPIATLLRGHLSGDVLIVNGGGILDFMSLRVMRAPAWTRGVGIEWIVRLSQDFRRLWRRYLLGNPVFLTRVLVLRYLFRPLP